MHRRYLQSALMSASLVIGFVLLVTTLQGCEPLRKKFTRQKKGDMQEQEYEPVLDPIDYPEKIYDPKADYAYRFSLLRVWEKELMAGIDDRASGKRLQYFLNNIIVQLEEMNKLVTEDKKSALTKAIQDFQSVLQTVSQPAQFYNVRDVGLRVEQISNPIFNEYKPQLMESNIKSLTP